MVHGRQGTVGNYRAFHLRKGELDLAYYAGPAVFSQFARLLYLKGVLLPI